MDNNKIIHLFITDKCFHDCEYCCNKQYDIDRIPVVTVDELKYADTICITGGEPFLDNWSCNGTSRLSRSLREEYKNIKNIYVYTSGKKVGALSYIDGLNISPKDEDDVEWALWNLSLAENMNYIKKMKSNRLYCFPEVDTKKLENYITEYYSNFEIIKREWQTEFNADSGIFRRLPILF